MKLENRWWQRTERNADGNLCYFTSIVCADDRKFELTRAQDSYCLIKTRSNFQRWRKLGYETVTHSWSSFLLNEGSSARGSCQGLDSISARHFVAVLRLFLLNFSFFHLVETVTEARSKKQETAGNDYSSRWAEI